MNRLVVAVFCLLLSSGVAFGEENLADTPHCKKAIASVIERTGGLFGGYGRSGDDVYIRFGSYDLNLHCRSTLPPLHSGEKKSFNVEATLNFGSLFPPNVWYSFLAGAGSALSSEDVNAFNIALRRCYSNGLADKSKMSDVSVGNALITCSIDSVSFWMQVAVEKEID
jgi:hypothetical protein